MKKHKQTQNWFLPIWKSSFFLFIILSTLAACDTGLEDGLEDGLGVEAFDPDVLIANGEMKEMKLKPIEIRDGAVDAQAQRSGFIDVNFDDPRALKLIPDVNSTFVTYPGYLGFLGGGIWMPLWLSGGPAGGASDGDHYHIVWDSLCVDINGNELIYGQTINGECVPVENIDNLNRYHSAMFGDEWLTARAGRMGDGPKNFDLTRIRVKGTVPIRLHFKDANDNWFFWNQIDPGYWNLPGATNIKEFHIRATSNGHFDSYSLDDIRVRAYDN